MKCPNFHGINFRHITHGTKSSALLFIESYKKSENPHSLNHSDPMTPSLFFGFNIAFISILLFLFLSPQVSYLVCFQPQMYTKITITKNEKCTQILFQFFFLVCGALDAQVPFASILLANGTHHKTPSLKFKRRKK